MIDTARLTLRAVGLDDAGFILDLLNQPSWLARPPGEAGVVNVFVREGGA